METEMKRILSVDDSAVLKGVAIICIVLHNFCHWLPGCAVENEYVFLPDRISRFVSLLTHRADVLLNIFSFAGHYGVAVFLFLSGYGLVRKYEVGNDVVAIRRFMWYHIKKLWWLLCPALILWFVSDMYLHQWHWSHHWYNVVQLVTFTGNLFPGTDLLLGPWWYFSLTIQLYLVYRLFLYKRGWIPLGVITSLCMGTMVLALCMHNMALLEYFRYNFIGSMLPFALGITMARTSIYYDWTYAGICFVVWIACWFDAMSWLAAPVFFILAIMPLVGVRGVFRKVIIWVGELSAFLFVVHPIVRPYLIQNVKAGGNSYVSLMIYLICAFVMAMLYRIVVTRLKGYLISSDILTRGDRMGK